MIILGIDPGFDKVGYSIFDKSPKGNANFTYITSDLIKTDKKDLHEKRLEQIFITLGEIIKQYKPVKIVVEQLFMFKNQKTVIQVAQAIGVIELVAAIHNVAIERLTPLQIKEIVTGNGAADKIAVRKMVEMTIKEKIIFKDDDQADAVACGLAFCFLNESLR